MSPSFPDYHHYMYKHVKCYTNWRSYVFFPFLGLCLSQVKQIAFYYMQKSDLAYYHSLNTFFY